MVKESGSYGDKDFFCQRVIGSAGYPGTGGNGLGGAAAITRLRWSLRRINIPTRPAVTNPQLARDTLVLMVKSTAASPQNERPYKTTGLHLPADLWELLNRVAFERSRTRGGRASVSALLVDMIEQHRKELEKELAAANR